MSNGYAGNFAIVIPDAAVKKVVGKKVWDAFQRAYQTAREAGLGDSELFTADIVDCTDAERVLIQAYLYALSVITNQFVRAANLELSRSYHDSEHGGDEQYDDVNGSFWELPFSQAYVPSPDLVALNKKVGKKNRSNIRHYVTFG